MWKVWAVGVLAQAQNGVLEWEMLWGVHVGCAARTSTRLRLGWKETRSGCRRDYRKAVCTKEGRRRSIVIVIEKERGKKV